MWNVNCCWAEPSRTLTGLTRLLHNLESRRALASLHTADTSPLPGNRKPWTPLMMCLGAAGWPPLRAERPTCPITHEQFILHGLIGVRGGKHIHKCGVETVERSSESLKWCSHAARAAFLPLETDSDSDYRLNKCSCSFLNNWKLSNLLYFFAWLPPLLQ